ncbi:MAG: MarR family transcriptional regulator [Rhodospirillum sp.]|nr:MarR family transcriptional regulator [Rhodospirillum sp.]MCF8491921.1 MarR family transcriptional regulator [Rhodospirillum sp.]MCF8500804.1 MarR family transcriptional regulator [Rhodospirillum sp.]
MSGESRADQVFTFFTEINILAQLSSTLMNRNLPDGLSVAHFSILHHMVRRGDGQTPLDLATAFQVTKATMSHSIDVLSRRGFIRVERSVEDGRSKRIYLTEEGRTFRERAMVQATEAVTGLLEELDLEKLTALLPTLRAVREVLDRKR